VNDSKVDQLRNILFWIIAGGNLVPIFAPDLRMLSGSIVLASFAGMLVFLHLDRKKWDRRLRWPQVDRERHGHRGAAGT
jgi:hypothetical protein